MEFRACTQPWFELQLMYNRVSRFCCYHDYIPFGELNIPSLWNSPLFRRTRREIAVGNESGTRCDQCPYLKYVETPLFLDIPPHVTGVRRDNWDQALKHFHAGDDLIESLPVKYYVQFGLACNLRCIMCDHPTQFNSGENQQFDPEILLSKTEYLAVASSVHIIGGEPFLLPSAVRFIDRAVARADLRELDYNFYTNGFLIDRFIERLSPLERIVMTISIDSYGSYYEYIRQRASWRRLTENIKAFQEHGKSRHKAAWRVHIACIVMKSGILGLPDLVDWAIDNDCVIHFAPVYDHTEVARDEENVFSQPHLLAEIPGWEDALERASCGLASAGYSAAANQLTMMRRELLEKFHGWTEATAAASTVLDQVRGWNFWRPLIAVRGADLVHRLEKNIYGKGAARAIDRSGDAFVFTPTNPRDHLALPFVPVEADEEAGHFFVKLDLSWPQQSDARRRCQYVLQDQTCATIKPLGQFGGTGEESVVYFKASKAVKQIRVVLNPLGSAETAMPESVSIEVS